MKNPAHDPLDAMLEQALHGASHGLAGETFTRQLAGRIAKQQRLMRLRRALPPVMGLLAAVIVLLVARPKIDFQGGASLLAAMRDNARFALAWVTQPIPGGQTLLFLWLLLAAMALIFSHWFTTRETTVFEL